jgi:hypothetical protein
MIFSVYNYDNRRYDYYEGQGICPPHGWFRKASPGQMKQPEEIAAALPEGATLVGHGPLPRGIIATSIPGMGTTDDSGPTGNTKREAGLGSIAPVRRQQTLPASDPWESPNSRGRP